MSSESVEEFDDPFPDFLDTSSSNESDDSGASYIFASGVSDYSGESDDSGSGDRAIFVSLPPRFKYSEFIRPVRDNVASYKTLNLDNVRLSDTAWIMLGLYLQNNYRLNKICLDSCHLTMENLASLFSGPRGNYSIGVLSLRGNPFGSDGIRVLAPFLQNSWSIESLDLSYTDLHPEGMAVLAEALPGLSRGLLKHLNLSDNPIGDTGLARIVPFLNASQLEMLNLDRCSIHRDGCMMLAGTLGNEACALKSLELRSNFIDDEGTHALAESLLINKKLLQLELDGNVDITDAGVSSLLRLVCDTSSLENTCFSNHTLTSVGWRLGQTPVWHRLQDMLHYNERNHSKGRTCRAKIATAHLCGDLTPRGDFNVEPFLDIDVRVMPHVLAWVASIESTMGGGCNRLYLFMKKWNSPALFGFPSQERLRMGTEISQLEATIAAMESTIAAFKKNEETMKKENTDLHSENTRLALKIEEQSCGNVNAGDRKRPRD